MDDRTEVIVLHVIRGKYFPRFSGGLSLECCFLDFTQSTEPVQYQKQTDSVPWAHRFTFYVKKKLLTKYTSNRVPLKLLFYGVEQNYNRKLLGNMIISLREGGLDEKKKWRTVLNTKQNPAPSALVFFAIRPAHELEKLYEQHANDRDLVISNSKPTKSAPESEDDEDDNSKNTSRQTESEEESEAKQEESESEEESEDTEYTEDFEHKPETPKSEPPPTKIPNPNKIKKEAPRQPLVTEDLSPAKPLTPTAAVKPVVANGMQSMIDELDRCYRFGIDLKSVKDFAFTVPNMYLTYTYPPFGTDPVPTQPPIPVKERSADTPLPKSTGFSLFHFFMKKSVLQTNLEKFLLYIEVMDKGKSVHTYDTRIGVATVNLLEVFKATKSPISGGTLQVYDAWIPIGSIEDTNVRIGLIRIVLSLEDLGPNPAPPPPQPIQPPVHPALQGAPSGGPLFQRVNPTSPSRIPIPMQAQLDIEKWKQVEQERFAQKLKQKEQAYLLAMETEWKKRITDQELIVTKKKDECLKLEERLKKMLGELEKREQKLLTAEEELRRTKVILQSEYEAKLTQVESIEKQAQRELAQQREIEQMKGQELERQRRDLERKLKEEEQRYRELDKEFQAFKTRELTPEAKLKSEYLSLTNHKIELERKLEKTLRKKKELKEKLQKEREDNRKMREDMTREHEERVRRDQKELENTRMRFLNKEQELGRNEKQELESLRQQLKSLRNDVSNWQLTGSRLSPTVQGPEYMRDLHYNSLRNATMATGKGDAELERLLKEKDDLLKTGMYNEDHKIIKRLNSEIEKYKRT